MMFANWHPWIFQRLILLSAPPMATNSSLEVIDVGAPSCTPLLIMVCSISCLTVCAFALTSALRKNMTVPSMHVATINSLNLLTKCNLAIYSLFSSFERLINMLPEYRLLIYMIPELSHKESRQLLDPVLAAPELLSSSMADAAIFRVKAPLFSSPRDNSSLNTSAFDCRCSYLSQGFIMMDYLHVPALWASYIFIKAVCFPGLGAGSCTSMCLLEFCFDEVDWLNTESKVDVWISL